MCTINSVWYVSACELYLFNMHFFSHLAIVSSWLRRAYHKSSVFSRWKSLRCEEAVEDSLTCQDLHSAGTLVNSIKSWLISTCALIITNEFLWVTVSRLRYHAVYDILFSIMISVRYQGYHIIVSYTGGCHFDLATTRWFLWCIFCIFKVRRFPMKAENVLFALKTK